MLTEFEGLESLVPRPARIELLGRHVKGQISITPLRLLDGDLEDAEVARHVRRRWEPVASGGDVRPGRVGAAGR
jgi:hypothetical protein